MNPRPAIAGGPHDASRHARLAALTALLVPGVAAMAQPSKQSPDSTLKVLLFIGLLIVVATAGGLLVLWVRRRILSRGADAESQASLLDGLRAMRDRGELSPEEYERARRSVVDRVRAGLRDSVRNGLHGDGATPLGGERRRPGA